MINTLSVLFGIVFVVLVVVRAALLDRLLPWFKPPPAEVRIMRAKRKPEPFR